MDPEAETALRKSIAKWQANARAETPDDVKMGAGDCPLCHLYHPGITVQGSCRRCPVYGRTGNQFCRRTPFSAAADAIEEWGIAIDEGSPYADSCKKDAHAAAQAMADFLTGLLPEEKQ